MYWNPVFFLKRRVMGSSVGGFGSGHSASEKKLLMDAEMCKGEALRPYIVNRSNISYGILAFRIPTQK